MADFKRPAGFAVYRFCQSEYMITLEQYFGAKPHTAAEALLAQDLLERVNSLLVSIAWVFPQDPDTGTAISGARGGSGDGGFRLPTATTGRPRSSHKEATGVDVYDPRGELAGRISDTLLAIAGLYREHPDATPGWCHLTTRAPGSGKRTFYP